MDDRRAGARGTSDPDRRFVSRGVRRPSSTTTCLFASNMLPDERCRAGQAKIIVESADRAGHDQKHERLV
eukprot:2484620-Prymnesium_polylepis.1